jgi:hypothetical protein
VTSGSVSGDTTGDLRQQLEAATAKAAHERCEWWQRHHGHEGSTQHGVDVHADLAADIVTALLPIVKSRVAAARSETAREIAEAIADDFAAVARAVGEENNDG